LNVRYPEHHDEILNALLTHENFKGIKLHPVFHDFPMPNPAYEIAWKFAGKQTPKTPILVHTWDAKGTHPYDFEAMAQKYPDVPLVFGHAGMPDFQSAIQVAKRNHNVYLDLCASGFHEGIVEYFVSEIGSRRILFGTDMGGWHSLLFGAGSTLYADIPEDDKMNILRNNALRLIGLASDI